MCRFIAYMGKPILMDQILFRPENSLIKQSIRATETLEPLNGDGFGIGWYNHDIDKTPAVFTSIKPAWNDRNLQNIAPKILSSCFFAHVRSANVGDVTKSNCHPFYFERFLFMHNGMIGGFETIKRKIRREISDDVYMWIKGQTDSEHLCAVFLELFHKNNAKYTVNDISATLKETVDKIAFIQKKYKCDETSFLNVALTDGHNTVALRHTTDPDQHARTLYYSIGKEFIYRQNACRMLPSDNGTGAVVIASEKLTSYQGDWQSVPVNHMLTVNRNLATKIVDIKEL